MRKVRPSVPAPSLLFTLLLHSLSYPFWHLLHIIPSRAFTAYVASPTTVKEKIPRKDFVNSIVWSVRNENDPVFQFSPRKQKVKNLRLEVPIISIVKNATATSNSSVAALERGRTENNNREDLRRKDYEVRRALWEERYGSVEALRQTFGKSTSFWGDLDPESTRELYHTLLPRALLALYEAGLMRPDELAPLAYKARKAAKEYARERCTLPGRLAAQAFDGWRSFLRDGTFQTTGLSWEQLWDKYEAEIVAEECVVEIKTGRAYCRVDELTLADRIYLRILERSCATNQAFDRMLLKKRGKMKNLNKENEEDDDDDDDDEEDDDDEDDSGDDDDDEDDLLLMSVKLEKDVREILLSRTDAKRAVKYSEKKEKERVKQEQKEAKEIRLQKEKAEKAAKEEEKKAEKLKKQRYKALRKALRKAARRRQEAEDADEKAENDEAKIPVVNIMDMEQNHQKGGKTVKGPKQLEENDEKEQKRQLYPVLRLLAKTQRFLGKKGRK